MNFVFIYAYGCFACMSVQSCMPGAQKHTHIIKSHAGGDMDLCEPPCGFRWRPLRATMWVQVEVWTFVSHHVGSGNQTWVLCSSNKCSQLLSHLSSAKFP